MGLRLVAGASGCGVELSLHGIHPVALKFTIEKYTGLQHRFASYLKQTSPIPPAIVSSPPAHFGLL